MPGLRYDLREDNEELALDAMQAKAKELDVRGVAWVFITNEDMHPNGAKSYRPAFRICGRVARKPDPSKGSDDTGADYLSISWSKIAEMVLTGVESGTSNRPAKKGELKLRGGRTRWTNTTRIFTGFSGGTEDQDVLIATAGMDAMYVE